MQTMNHKSLLQIIINLTSPPTHTHTHQTSPVWAVCHRAEHCCVWPDPVCSYPPCSPMFWPAHPPTMFWPNPPPPTHTHTKPHQCQQCHRAERCCAGPHPNCFHHSCSLMFWPTPPPPPHTPPNLTHTHTKLSPVSAECHRAERCCVEPGPESAPILPALQCSDLQPPPTHTHTPNLTHTHTPNSRQCQQCHRAERCCVEPGPESAPILPAL